MIQKLLRRKPPKDTLYNGNGSRPRSGLVQGESKLMSTFFGLAIALGLGTLVTLILVANNRALATRGKVFVQMADGTTQLAQEFDVNYRRPEIIKETAVRWMQLAFEWDNRIPGDDKAVDEGINFDRSNKRIPTKVYLASYLMEPGFRQEFLRLMASEVIPIDVMTGRRKSVLRFYSVSDPRQVAKNRWEVDIVATRIERSATQELGETRVNRTITLQSIPPVAPVFKDGDPEVWRKTLYELSKNGLMIVEIKPLNL
ncbi:hypothetical protein [Leptolyngbya ohadii]|uniref:hypothetical protein n=1 Tax=Leptolyngbya ohadii TaxID=1962290 RepID=UPI000B5A1CD9|nr:hypothetical protein [Leptolyngbya ohadii]